MSLQHLLAYIFLATTLLACSSLQQHPAPELLEGRYGHAAVIDGSIYVIGGNVASSGSALDSIQSFPLP